jgi:hypothetical protein
MITTVSSALGCLVYERTKHAMTRAFFAMWCAHLWSAPCSGQHVPGIITLIFTMCIASTVYDQKIFKNTGHFKIFPIFIGFSLHFCSNLAHTGLFRIF